MPTTRLSQAIPQTRLSPKPTMKPTSSLQSAKTSNSPRKSLHASTFRHSSQAITTSSTTARMSRLHITSPEISRLKCLQSMQESNHTQSPTPTISRHGARKRTISEPSLPPLLQLQIFLQFSPTQCLTRKKAIMLLSTSAKQPQILFSEALKLRLKSLCSTSRLTRVSTTAQPMT